MKIVTKAITRSTPKHFMLIAVFMLVLMGTVGLGLYARANGSAAVIRDSNPNSIDNTAANGGYGAADANELIADVNSGGPSDLQTIYSFFGMSPDKYDRFKSTAKQGMAYRDGTVKVDGQTVMTNAWSIGRQRFSYSKVYPIPGAGSTYSSWHTDVLKQDLPVMVMFGDDGSVEFAVLNACGNPVRGVNVKPDAVCNALVKTADATNPNKYTFTTDAAFAGNASLSRVVYHFSDDNSTVEKSGLTQGVDHIFKKDAKVTVTVYARVPGGKEIVARVINCETQVKYVPPFYACVNLMPATIDKEKRSFSFTVIAKMDSRTTLTAVDFILDNKTTTTGVTTKDKDGNIYKEYSFTDDQKHTIKTTLHFNTIEGVQSLTCEASVTPEKTPVCTVPGKENLPPNSPECGYCKPGIVIGSPACVDVPPTPPVMPNTGPGDVFGLFAGTSAAGFIGHKFFMNRRGRKQAL